MTRFERATQIARWLMTEFPLPDDLRLEMKDRIFYEGRECHGMTYPVNSRMTIFLSDKANPRHCDMIETVIHEAAHAQLYDKGLGIFHGDRYWHAYGRMKDAFEHHGEEDSRSFERS